MPQPPPQKKPQGWVQTDSEQQQMPMGAPDLHLSPDAVFIPSLGGDESPPRSACSSLLIAPSSLFGLVLPTTFTSLLCNGRKAQHRPHPAAQEFLLCSTSLLGRQIWEQKRGVSCFARPPSFRA